MPTVEKRNQLRQTMGTSGTEPFYSLRNHVHKKLYSHDSHGSFYLHEEAVPKHRQNYYFKTSRKN